MSEHKIFAGPRIKRIRTNLGLSQTAMALALDISPSYLNLIERNQRPLTVQLIMKLSKTYDVSPEELEVDADGVVTALKEVFSDSILEGELPGYEELFEVADAAPNVANGILKLHDGYRKVLERLSELNSAMAEQGDYTAKDSLPHDLFFTAREERPNYFDGLDRKCEEFLNHLNLDLGLWASLQEWLLSNHHIRVQLLPVDVMPEWRARYDKHSLRLFISDRLSWPKRIEALANHVARFAFNDELDDAAKRLGLRDKDAKALARQSMAHYAAHALMMPYRRFHQTSARMKYDVEALAARFGVTFGQIAFRLTSLKRAGSEGPNFSLMLIEQAGNTLRRLGRDGFPRTDFGGGCAKLDIYATFAQRRSLLVSKVEQINHKRYLTLSKIIDTENGRFGGAAHRRAIMMICPEEEREKTIYVGVIGNQITPIGPNCRLCERAHCVNRFDAPITRPLALDEAASSISEFDFKS